MSSPSVVEIIKTLKTRILKRILGIGDIAMMEMVEVDDDNYQKIWHLKTPLTIVRIGDTICENL